MVQYSQQGKEKSGNVKRDSKRSSWSVWRPLEVIDFRVSNTCFLISFIPFFFFPSALIMSLSIRVVGCLETLDWSLVYFGAYQPAPLCNQWVREVLLTKIYPIRNNFTGGNCVISCLLKNELFRVRGFGPGWLQGLILIILDHTSRSQVCTSILGALCTPSYHKVYYDIILMKHNIFNKHWFSSHMLSIPPDIEGVRC